MELKDYARVLRVRWPALVSCLLVGLLVGIGSLFIVPKVYASRAEVFVAPRAGSTGSDLNQGSNFVLSRVKSYVEIMGSEVVLGPVVDRLDLPETSRELAGQVEAEVVGDTSLISVRVTDRSPERAAAIANAIVEEFVEIAPELEPVGDDGRRQSVVQVTIVQTAVAAVEPVSPSARLNLALGLVGGIALGLAVAVLADLADRRVRGVRQVEAITDAAIIGRIPFGRLSDGQLPRFHGEAIRDLRTNLEFLGGRSEASQALVLTSSRPQEGKSSIGIALAESLGEVGKSVLLLEADLRRPVLADRLNLEPSVGLSSILIGAAQLADVVQPWGDHGLHVVVAGKVPPNPSELLAGRRMEELLAQTRGAYDVVILDAPPLLPVTDSVILATLCEGAVVVVQGGRSAVTRGELRESLSKLESVHAPVLGIVANKLSTRGVDAVRTARYGYAADETTA